LKSAKNAAETSSREKGELLAKMSHELRISVNAIIGTTERARTAELTIEQREYLASVIASAGTLLDVVQHVLDARR
jgi:signal transduction histidine kinase